MILTRQLLRIYKYYLSVYADFSPHR
jgi:hypothetical protein